MSLRQIELFLNAVAQSHTKPLPTPKGDQRLGQLITTVLHIRPGIEKPGNPL